MNERLKQNYTEEADLSVPFARYGNYLVENDENAEVYFEIDETRIFPESDIEIIEDGVDLRLISGDVLSKLKTKLETVYQKRAIDFYKENVDSYYRALVTAAVVFYSGTKDFLSFDDFHNYFKEQREGVIDAFSFSDLSLAINTVQHSINTGAFLEESYLVDAANIEVSTDIKEVLQDDLPDEEDIDDLFASFTV